MLITIQTGKKDKTRLALFGKEKCGDAGAFLSDAPRDFTPEHGRSRGQDASRRSLPRVSSAGETPLN
ncbi:hypothetical protein N7519_011524 [Penicillium mononematosum]|uniref:uncharacterized protein n=1 Tax=Penicillium mononematosum TaxID=268346 RepID=UPI0025478EBE|nr:uncharacterized protein N7519_011524 [Penicillium mononematosum]KAJ6181063.1 hypothetical protein N7519_011524 [Penicillium mononematosum]